MVENTVGNPCPRCGCTKYITVCCNAVSYGDVQLVDGEGVFYDAVHEDNVMLDEDTDLPAEFERYGIRNNTSASGIEVFIEICVGCGTAVGAPCYDEQRKVSVAERKVWDPRP